MKKIILLFTFTFLLSCSSSVDNSSNNSNAISGNDFHPPTWIQGNYRQSMGSTIIGQNGFNFPANDLVIVTSAGSLVSQQGYVNLGRTGGQTVKVVETITNTLYSAEINYSFGQTTTYTFDKISTTKIGWKMGTQILEFTRP